MVKTNFSTFQGSDYTITLTFKDTSDVLIANTAYTVFLTLKTNKSDLDASAVLAKTYTVTTDGNGQVLIALTNTDTANLLGTYYYDCKYKGSDNKVYAGLIGVFTFEPMITIKKS